MSPGWARLAGALSLIGLFTGCAGAPAPTGPAPSSGPARPALPARPVELRLDGIDPCALLTDAQRRQLGVTAGIASGNDNFGGPLRGPLCVWNGAALRPDFGYTGGAILNHGAEYGLGLEPPRMVDGFAATTAGSLGSDPNYFCGMLVDVAPGQALSAAYSNNSHDVPGMNHQVACDKAQQLASYLLSNLRAIKRR